LTAALFALSATAAPSQAQSQQKLEVIEPAKPTPKPAPAPAAAPPAPAKVQMPAAPAMPAATETKPGPAVGGVLNQAGIDGASAARDPERALSAVEGTIPLPAETKNLRDQAPADREALAKKLKLHGSPAKRTDFTGKTPSVPEIVDALR
jgi:hypothetical protein